MEYVYGRVDTYFDSMCFHLEVVIYLFYFTLTVVILFSWNMYIYKFIRQDS